MRVDLVNDGQKVVRPQTASPMNLVYADGFDPVQLAVRQAPLDKPFHRPVDRFPTGQKHARGFPPTHPPPPLREAGHHRAGPRTLTVAPRNVLDYDSMLGTLHSPTRVAEGGGDAPQRHENPAPLRQAVTARRRLRTTRPPPRCSGMRH